MIIIGCTFSSIYVWKLFQRTELQVPVPRRYSYRVPGNHTPHCQRSSESHDLQNKETCVSYLVSFIVFILFLPISFIWYSFSWSLCSTWQLTLKHFYFTCKTKILYTCETSCKEVPTCHLLDVDPWLTLQIPGDVGEGVALCGPWDQGVCSHIGWL